MQKRSFFVIILLSLVWQISSIKALTIGDCQVLASYKQSSSLDTEKYICKGQSYGNVGEAIYYSGEGNSISLTNFNAYYFATWDKTEVTLNLNEENNIAMFHVGELPINVVGTGSLKFKEDAYVKLVVNGEMVYRFVYNDKTLISNDEIVYEDTLSNFKTNYVSLKEKNNLPEEFNEEDYSMVQAVDYVSMTSVSVTESWLAKHIKTELVATVADGYGIIKYEKKTEETKEEVQTTPTTINKTTSKTKKKTSSKTTTLKTDKVILISDTKLNNKYKLNVNDLDDKKSEYTEKVEDFEIVSLYDVSIYNGKKEVEMKDNSFIIKIKLDENTNYDNYKIIYVNDDGEIAEYIDGTIEDGYIVFKTTHLSQYGVIGQNEKEEVLEANVLEPEKKNNNIGNILKISLIVLIALPLMGLIIYLVIKSHNLQGKKGA